VAIPFNEFITIPVNLDGCRSWPFDPLFATQICSSVPTGIRAV